MTDTIEMRSIGIIHTPYHEQDEIPIQGKFKPDVEGWLELEEQYEAGLKDLDGFTCAILLYHFHRSDKVTLTGLPFLEDTPRGIFAIRSPHRPNHIGLSVVPIKRIQGRRVCFTHVDMLDGTPLLDIKPYVSHFDCVEQASSGWLDKHFAEGNVPARAKDKTHEHT